MNELAQKMEAMLFIAGEPVTKRDLIQAMSIDAEALEEAMRELGHALNGHGITLLIANDSVQLVTAPIVAEYIAQFVEKETLSRAASETLALIAYRGPISRYDINVIRGVDSGRMIQQLLRRGVIEKVHRESKTVMYDITQEFLQHMGMQSREELPKYDVLSSAQRIEDALKEHSPS